MPYFNTTDNCKIYYESKGTGEPIIFMHGLTASRLSFMFQVPELSKKYRVITYDHRGHGASDHGPVTESDMTIDRLARDLHELIEYLELDAVHVCGWSLGGATLLNYIRLFGTDKLMSAGIVEITPKLLADETWKLGQSKTFDSKENTAFVTALSRSLKEGMDMFLPLTFPKWRLSESDFKELYETKLAIVLNNTPHCILSLWISLADKDFRDVLPEIDVPLFLAFSEDGQLYSPEHGEYYKQNVADAHLYTYPRCGHGLFADDFEKFNRDYDSFLEYVTQKK